MQANALKKKIEDALSQALSLAGEKDVEAAVDILRQQIEAVEALNLYNDGRADYYDFNTLMEMVMFQSQHPEIHPVSDIEEPLNRLYAMYGSLLLEQGKLDEAQEALAIGADMANAIDSALVWQKRNDAAELSVIYQTHETEMALEESKDKEPADSTKAGVSVINMEDFQGLGIETPDIRLMYGVQTPLLKE